MKENFLSDTETKTITINQNQKPMNLPDGIKPEDLMKDGKLSPFIKNLFFTALESNTMDATKKQKLDVGRITNITYLLNGGSAIHKQRLYFSKIPFVQRRDELDVTDGEVQKFLTFVGMNWHDEKKKIKYAFVKMDFKTQDISFERHDLDGTKKETTL